MNGCSHRSSQGIDQTVTQGIISAKHRRESQTLQLPGFLQTDAAINPVTAVATSQPSGRRCWSKYHHCFRPGGFEGSVCQSQAIFPDMWQDSYCPWKVERGWIGISAQDLTPESAKNLATETRKGILIGDVVKGGPADKAGIKKNDVVIAFQGKEVSNAATLRNEISLSPIGKDIRMVILRGGRKQEATVRIGDSKDAVKALSTSVRERLGVDVRSLTQKEADKFRLNINEGVLVTFVDQKGPLGRVGFEVGDIILEINGQSVGGIEGFSQMIASLRPNQRITLLAFDHSSGNSGYVNVTSR